jgi:hypothetical protein
MGGLEFASQRSTLPHPCPRGVRTRWLLRPRSRLSAMSSGMARSPRLRSFSFLAQLHGNLRLGCCDDRVDDRIVGRAHRTQRLGASGFVQEPAQVGTGLSLQFPSFGLGPGLAECGCGWQHFFFAACWSAARSSGLRLAAAMLRGPPHRRTRLNGLRWTKIRARRTCSRWLRTLLRPSRARLSRAKLRVSCAARSRTAAEAASLAACADRVWLAKPVAIAASRRASFVPWPVSSAALSPTLAASRFRVGSAGASRSATCGPGNAAVASRARATSAIAAASDRTDAVERSTAGRARPASCATRYRGAARGVSRGVVANSATSATSQRMGAVGRKTAVVAGHSSSATNTAACPRPKPTHGSRDLVSRKAHSAVV